MSEDLSDYKLIDKLSWAATVWATDYWLENAVFSVYGLPDLLDISRRGGLEDAGTLATRAAVSQVLERDP